MEEKRMQVKTKKREPERSGSPMRSGIFLEVALQQARTCLAGAAN